jgi:LysM repeat protein
MTPPDVESYELQLPPHALEGFAERLAAAPEDIKAPLMVVELGRGQSLGSLATRHKVRLADIKLLNPSAKGRAGEKITLPIDEDGTRYADKESRPPVVTYKVRRGDTLSGIARKYNVSVATLRNVNGLRGNQIRIGQRLKVPSRGYVASTPAAPKQYKVRPGDTLSEIARKYRTSPSELAKHNGIRGDVLYAGQLLKIP